MRMMMEPTPLVSSPMDELMRNYKHLQQLALTPTEAAVREEMRCGYSSKRCENSRTNKKGGGMHRFCEFHRRRANRNQWRVDNKRRLMQTQQPPATKSATTTTNTSAIQTSPTAVPVVAVVTPTTANPSPRVVKRRRCARPVEAKLLPDPVMTSDGDSDQVWISESEIAMLQSILFDDEEADGVKGNNVGFLNMLQAAQKTTEASVISSPTAVNDLARVKEWLV